MQRLNATVEPSPDAAKAATRAGEAQVSARSAVYLNGLAARSSLRRLYAGRRPVAEGEVLPVGAHLLTPRRGYTHHGIYVGEGRVVHYAGLARAIVRGPIEEVSLDVFADGQRLYVKLDRAPAFAPAAIVARARSRLGENRYRITTNNCEHFCEWCLRGENRSEQVERWLAWPRAIVRRLEASLHVTTMLRRRRSRAVVS